MKLTDKEKIIEKYKWEYKKYEANLIKNKWEIFYKNHSTINLAYKDDIKIHNNLINTIKKSSDIEKLKQVREKTLNDIEIVDWILKYRHNLGSVDIINNIDNRIKELSKP
jgi:hypothetical protein